MAKTAVVTSAGGVIFRVRDGEAEVALTATDGRSRWKLPKGLVESHESLEEAALREVREETGLTGEIVGKIGQIDYWFYWRPKETRFHKFVHFFLVRHTGGNEAMHNWEIEEVAWFPIKEALGKLTYKSERDILEKAETMMEESSK